MKILRTISRIIVGLVFIFSGFVKAVDPLGFAYKFGDYFEAFNLDFLVGIALPLALIMSSLEFIIGVVMLLGIRIRVFSWMLLVVMSYFFVLTFIIALTNPVTDCGCFGDFLILTNWETFYKNVVLMAFTIFIFRERRNYKELYPMKTEWMISGAITIFIIWISVFCLRHLPIFDFRPYHIGAHIPTKMELPEGAQVDEYKTTLVYEKDGVQKEFSLYDTTWRDGTWTWVETKQELIKKGDEPEIHDFIISDKEGNDITWDIITDYGYVFFLVSHKINLNNEEAYLKADEINLFCQQQEGFTFYAVTSSTNEEIEKLKEKTGINFEFGSADNITLKTIVRSKPGLLLIKEGVVLEKWHFRDLPKVEDFNENYMADIVNSHRISYERGHLFIFIFISLTGILLGRIFINRKKSD